MQSEGVLATSAYLLGGTGIESQEPSEVEIASADEIRLLGNLKPSITTTCDARWSVAISGVVYIPPESGFSIKRQAEFVLELLREGQLDAMLNLSGHFVAMVLDKQVGSLIAFGDRDGGRRVFVAEGSDGQVAVSSKLRILRDRGIATGRPEVSAREFGLIYGYQPGLRTVYDGVERLPANNYLEISAGGHYRVIDRPAAMGSPRRRNVDVLDVETELHERLSTAVDLAVRDVEHVAVLLGGFDSALVAAMAVKSGKRVTAYTFAYTDGQYNQRNVDSVVAALGIEHKWISIGPEDIAEGLANYSAEFDRPTNWPNYVIQTRKLCLAARDDGAEIVLTGDGCDEIFLGYPGIYRGSKFFGGSQRLNARVGGVLKRLAQRRSLEMIFGHTYRLGLRTISNWLLPVRTRLYLMFRIMDESTLHYLFGWDVRKMTQSVSKMVQEVEEIIPASDATVLAYTGRDHIVPNRLKLSGAMDAAGLPVTTPYMQPAVRDYVRSLPESMLRPTSEAKRTSLGKDVLLTMAAKYELLPESVIYQPKHAAVDGPLDKWYENELSSLVRAQVKNIDEIADPAFLTYLLKEKRVDKWYRKNHSVDSITSHAVSILTTYGSFFDEPVSAGIPDRVDPAVGG